MEPIQPEPVLQSLRWRTGTRGRADKTMSFIAYIAIVFVSIAGILLELDWLTKPKLETRSPVQIVTRTVAPAPQANAKVKGQSTDLTPVDPKNAETRQSDDTVHDSAVNPPPAKQPPAANSSIANTTQAEHQAAATKDAAPQAQRADGSTGGRAPAAESPPAPAAVVPPSAQTHSVAAEANRCDVRACSSAYQSFRVSDCTYQPFEGPRRVCEKPSAIGRAMASQSRAEPRGKATYRERDDDARNVVVRRVTPIDADDDVDYEDDRGTAHSQIIVIEPPAPGRW